MNQIDNSDDSHKKEGLESQLESSFQSSFRSTSTHLKVYNPDATGEACRSESLTDAPGATAKSASGASDGAKDRNGENAGKENVRETTVTIEPPAGRHAPHHSWLLGTYGGRRKPQAVHNKDGVSGLDLPMPGYPQGLTQLPSGAPPAPGAPGIGALSETPAASANQTTVPAVDARPDDYRIPANAKGALPPETYEQPDLYAATVEVQKPAPSYANSNSDAEIASSKDEPFDDSVAHLYSQTVDVNKPGRLTRFPDDTLEPSLTDQQSEVPKFGAPGGFSSGLAQPASEKEMQIASPQTEPSKPVVSSGALPPPVPLQSIQLSVQARESDPQGRSRTANPQSQSPESTPDFSAKQPPGLPSPGNSHLQSGTSQPSTQPQTGKSESNLASEPLLPGNLPAKGSKAASSVPAALTPPVPQIVTTPPRDQEPPKRRTPKSSDEQEQTGTTGDGGPRRKRRLHSYVDRQIGNYDDEQDSDKNEDATASFRKKSSFPAKTVGLTVAALIALGAIGFVSFEMINGRGSSWMPSVGNGEWKSWNDKADVAMAHGSFDEAVRYLDNAIKSNSSQATLYHKRGLAKSQLENTRAQNASALNDLDKALEVDPKLLEALIDRAAVRIKLGQYDQAVDDYNKLIAAGKDTDKVRYGRGLAKFYAEEYAEAEIDFTNVLKQNPDNVDASIALGTTLYKSKADKDGAVTQFMKAAKFDKSGLADRNLGILAYESGPEDYQNARKFYSEAIEKNQTDANLYNERGVICWLLKDPVGAAHDFRRAVGRDPNLEIATQNLDFVAKSLIDINPKSEVALTSIIELNLLRKDWSVAVNNADQLIKVAGWKDSGAYAGVLLKWAALEFEGRDDKAQDVLKDCIENAGSFGWPMPLVKYLSSGGKASFSMLDQEAEDLPQRTSAHYYAGISDYFAHKPDQAKQKLEWVVKQGAPANLEYPLAGRALQWIAGGGPDQSENKR